MTTLYARPLQLASCRHCHAPQLAGASEGFDVTAEPYALTQAGQLQAMLENRRIYTAHIFGKRVVVFPRHSWDIEYGKNARVLTEHKCRRPMPEFDADRSRIFVDILMPTIQEAACPF